MSKAVLVMDMPESCDMCDLTDMINGKMYCGVPGCGELVEDYIICRPDWCPIRQMPEKDKKQYSTGASNSYRNGWNACIDAIGGVDGE